jgi:hypothetical protein
MTFGEFVAKCKVLGVTDETPLFFIDVTTTVDDGEIHVGQSKHGTVITHWPYNHGENEE